MSDSIIKLSASEWTEDQRISVARVSAQTLTHVSAVLDERWCRHWWQELIDYLHVSQSQLEQRILPFDQALEHLTGERRDIRIEVLLELLAVALHVTDVVKRDAVMLYDARARAFLVELEHALGLCRGDLASVERSVAQQMYYGVMENKGSDVQQSMEEEAQRAIEATNRRQQAFRWIATGAGVIGGGAVIALTGGLAAPLLAPLLVGVTGATFFATAGGVALVTSLFGLTGDSEEEARSPWEYAFEGKRNNTDIFCLEYETKTLLELGYSFRRFIKDTAINYAGMEVAKATVLHAFFATILKIADVIDNPWQMAVDRSKKAGTELNERGCHGLVDNVVMMGAPISTEETWEWNNALNVVSGRFVNCYTPNDWVLAFVYRLHSLATNVAGLEAVVLPSQPKRIENVQVDIDGHTKYPTAIKDIMDQLKIE
ncbi:MAG: hypothetical protein EXX96DRAFT_490189 [Benjaminiella poitrasii]|nr:MAG: hypothetical protein EXX96DRAFT_490189 [Benjaminiella poitrasii]